MVYPFTNKKATAQYDADKRFLIKKAKQETRFDEKKFESINGRKANFSDKRWFAIRLAK